MSQQINLFNPAFLKQRRVFSLLTMLQGLGVILIGAVLVYAYALHQLSGLNEQSLQTTRRFNAEQARLINYSASYSPRQVNQQLQDEVLQWEKKVAGADQLVESLRSGSNTTGFSEYLRAFSRQIVPGLWLTSFKITASGIRLNGSVTDPALVPDYIQRLGSEPVMQGKRFANLQMQASKLKDAAPRYLDFTLYSLPDEEDKK